jgi:hypothetical protein
LSGNKRTKVWSNIVYDGSYVVFVFVYLTPYFYNLEEKSQVEGFWGSFSVWKVWSLYFLRQFGPLSYTVRYNVT